MINALAIGVLAYVLHEIGHCLACIFLSVPLKGVEIRKFGICTRRSRVHDWRDYAVSSAGILASFLTTFYALLHADPWFAFANTFMLCFAGIGDIRNMWMFFRVDRAMLRR